MNKWFASLAFLLMANNVSAEIKTNDCWVKEPVAGSSNTAIFLSFTNTGDKDVMVTSVTTPAAKMADFHTIKHNNGVVSMVPLGHIVVPAKGKTELKMGGKHVMLMGLKNKLYSGDWVDVEFKLSDGSRINREIEVQNSQQNSMGM